MDFSDILKMAIGWRLARLLLDGVQKAFDAPQTMSPKQRQRRWRSAKGRDLGKNTWNLPR